MRVTVKKRMEAQLKIMMVQKFVKDYLKLGAYYTWNEDRLPLWARKFVTYAKRCGVSPLMLDMYDQPVKRTFLRYIDELENKIKFRSHR